MLIFGKNLNDNRIRKIRKRDNHNALFTVSKLSRIDRKHLPTDRDLSHLPFDLVNRHRVIVKIPAVNHVWIVRAPQRIISAPACPARKPAVCRRTRAVFFRSACLFIPRFLYISSTGSFRRTSHAGRIRITHAGCFF